MKPLISKVSDAFINRIRNSKRCFESRVFNQGLHVLSGNSNLNHFRDTIDCAKSTCNGIFFAVFAIFSNNGA